MVPRNAVALTEQDKADASGVYEPPGDPVVERLAFSQAGDVMATVDSFPSTGGHPRYKPDMQPAAEAKASALGESCQTVRQSLLHLSGVYFRTRGQTRGVVVSICSVGNADCAACWVL